MKKLALLLLVVMTASVLFGCGPQYGVEYSESVGWRQPGPRFMQYWGDYDEGWPYYWGHGFGGGRRMQHQVIQ